MKKRGEGRGGQKKRSEGARLVRSKPTQPLSASSFVAKFRRENEKFEKRLELMGMTVMIDGLAHSVWREDYQELLAALRHTLREYDRAVGNCPDQSGWTAEDILRLEKIREMAKL